MKPKQRQFDGKPKPDRITRRGFAAGSAALAMGLAGCSGFLGDGDSEAEPAATTTPEETEPEAEPTASETQTDSEPAEEEPDTSTMRWERRPDAEGGRVAAMWLLVEDGSVLAELTVEDQRYRSFPDSFVTFLKDNDWVYEDTWNVLGQFDGFGPAVERAAAEVEKSDADPPSSSEMTVSEPSQPPFRGAGGEPAWYRRRDFEGGKELGVWVLFDGQDVLKTLMVESNQYTHAYGDDNSLASYVWMITPEEGLNRDADGTLNDDPATWSNITPFDDPHTNYPDAMTEAMTQLEESDYPVNDGVV